MWLWPKTGRIRFYAGLLLPSSIRICMDIDLGGMQRVGV
jgi:hypothetical protein